MTMSFELRFDIITRAPPPVASTLLLCAPLLLIPAASASAPSTFHIKPLDARFWRMIVSLHELNTTRTFSVSSAHVT